MSLLNAPKDVVKKMDNIKKIFFLWVIVNYKERSQNLSGKKFTSLKNLGSCRLEGYKFDVISKVVVEIC